MAEFGIEVDPTPNLGKKKRSDDGSRAQSRHVSFCWIRICYVDNTELLNEDSHNRCKVLTDTPMADGQSIPQRLEPAKVVAIGVRGVGAKM